MNTVAIICEYNPFHNGHKYQIDKIREEFGNDTAIIAIMSGNYTQRGDIAILDKAERASSALESGANLVLELPFPYSSASAEIFARAGVHIANMIGNVDYLSFGSESGDIDKLINTAKLMMSKEYNLRYNELKAQKNLCHPELCQLVLNSLSSDDLCVDLTPNNILAIEYIKALANSKSSIKPHTIKRMGSGYNDTITGSCTLQSATGIRNAVLDGDITALDYVPYSTKNTILNAMRDGKFPTNPEKLASVVISNLRLNSAPNDDIHDLGAGLYNRLRASSFKCVTIEQLVNLTETRKYTKARIRRAIWYSLFGVTSSEIKAMPRYTQILALDKVGMKKLKERKNDEDFFILTKPSNTAGLSEAALKQKTLADKADSIYQLSKPTFTNGNNALTLTPYVKK